MKINAPSKRLGWLATCAAGFSIAEAVISLGIGSFSLGGAMIMNSHHLKLVKSTQNSSASSHSLQERIEQLRIATWRQITDPQYVSGTFLATRPKSIAPLKSYTEQVTISAWPDPTATNKLIVERSNDGVARVISAGNGLSDVSLARIDVTISWADKDNRKRTRELATMISNGGVSRMNLPAMGAAGGASNSTASTSTTPSSGGTSTTSTTSTTTTTSSPPPTTTTTTTNGNGNGRGTVGGKPGKA